MLKTIERTSLVRERVVSKEKAIMERVSTGRVTTLTAVSSLATKMLMNK